VRTGEEAAVSEDAGLDIDFDDDAGIDADADAELAEIQGQVTAAPAGGDAPVVAAEVNGKAVAARTVELNGKKFRLAKKVGLMPMLKFSAYADVDTQDPRALGAMYSMLKDVIDPSDWRAFEDHATDSKADAEELLDMISAALQLIAGRPTGPPRDSSPGRRAISRGSTGSSSSRRGKASRR
jgi:hypothetical protein